MKFNINKLLTLGAIAGLVFSFNNIDNVNAQTGDIDNEGNGASCLDLAYNMRYKTRDASVNGEVGDLQDYLIAEGYMSGSPTGYFGVVTLKAVQKFQSANGLISSGYAGPMTRAKIKALSCDTVSVTTTTPAYIPYLPYSATPTNPIACTMEMRLCDDGAPMPRDANCGWHPEMCKSKTDTSKTNINSITIVPNPSYYGSSDAPSVKVTIIGSNFNQVESVHEDHQVDGVLTISRSQFIIANDNQISFNMKVCSGCKYTSTFVVSDKNGNKSNSMAVSIENFTQEIKPTVNSSFSNINSGIANGAAHIYNYNINNYRNGLVLDVEIKVNCAQTDYMRDCSKYTFNLSGMAADTYSNVMADPYVKGGSLNRFTGANGVINIYGAVDKNYYPVYPYKIPVPDSIEYNFILRDTNNGGTTLWNEVKTFNFKG